MSLNRLTVCLMALLGNMLNCMLMADGSKATVTKHRILESREERVSLLKTGFSGRDIELLYIKLNGFVITDVNWHKQKNRSH